MKRIFTLALLFVVSHTVYSQTYFKRILGPVSSNTRRLINTKDGGWIIIGVTGLTYNVTTEDFFAAKFNKNGKLQWTNRYGVDGRYEEGLSVTEEKTNGYLFSGFSTDGSNKRLGALMRVDSLGNKIWSKTFSGPTAFSLSSSIETSDGGFIAGGNLTNANGDTSQPALIKLTPNGKVSKYFKINLAKNTIFRKIIMAHNGDLVVLMDDGVPDRNKKLDVMRITQSGHIKWITRFGGPYSDYGYDMIETKDRGFVITGGSSHDHGGTDYLATTAKLDSAGNIQWYNSTNADNTQGSVTIYGYSILEDKDGSLISCGTVYRSATCCPLNIYLLKYGAGGNYITSSYIALPNDGNGSDDYGRGIIKVRDGYIVGVSTKNAVFAGILKADSNFSFCIPPVELVPTSQSNAFVQDTVNVSLAIQTGITDTDNLNTNALTSVLSTECTTSPMATTVNENKTNPLIISVYPNPANNYITVTFNTTKTTRTIVEVYDMTGAMLMQLPVNATAGKNIKQLNISALHSGSYKIKVSQANDDTVLTSQFYKQQ